MKYNYLGDETKLTILRTKKLHLEAQHYEHDMECKLAELLGDGYEDVVANTRKISDKFALAIASLTGRIEELEAAQPEPVAAPAPTA